MPPLTLLTPRRIVFVLVLALVLSAALIPPRAQAAQDATCRASIAGTPLVARGSNPTVHLDADARAVPVTISSGSDADHRVRLSFLGIDRNLASGRPTDGVFTSFFDVDDFSDDYAGTFNLTLESLDGRCSIAAEIEIDSGLFHSVVAKVSFGVLLAGGLAAAINFGFAINSGAAWGLKVRLTLKPERDEWGKWFLSWTFRATLWLTTVLAAPALFAFIQQGGWHAPSVEFALELMIPVAFVSAVFPLILGRLRA